MRAHQTIGFLLESSCRADGSMFRPNADIANDKQHASREQRCAKPGIEIGDETIRHNAGDPQPDAKRHHKHHDQIAFCVEETEEILSFFFILQNSVRVLSHHFAKDEYLENRVNGDGEQRAPPGEVPLIGDQSDTDNIETSDCPNDAGNQDQRLFLYAQCFFHFCLPPCSVIIIDRAEKLSSDERTNTMPCKKTRNKSVNEPEPRGSLDEKTLEKNA